MDYLSNLNDKQREAARKVDGPLLILAGAGSGKTSTMTRRIAYMVMEKGIHPYNILAVTFTNKAAREMRERVEQIIGEGTRMWILTFHSTCLRILRKYAERAGYTNDFTIYDTADQKAVVKKAMQELNISDKDYKPAAVLSVISKQKEKGIDAETFLKNAGFLPREKTYGRIYKYYESTLKKNNAMDFDDMIWRTVQIMQDNPDVLQEYRERFRYVMVDEYQDTNHLQYQLVKMLAEKSRNICVVGDDDQCIYEWRGADISNILNFDKDFPEAVTIKLEQNYRSKENILKAAHSVIRNNKGRKDKELWTEDEPGEQVTYKRLDNERAEARYAADQIYRLHREGRKYSDFAVLYRTNAQSRNFEDAFMADAIPYKVLAGTKFYDRKEVKDMLSYMRLVLNLSDDLSLMRIINEPKRGIGQKTLDKLTVLAQQREASLFEVLTDDEIVDGLGAKAAAGIHNLVRLIIDCHVHAGDMKVSDIYDRLFSDSGYADALTEANTIEAEGRLENLLEFKSAILDSEDENPEITLPEFLEQVALVADVDSHDPDEDAVVLMTLHSAKGLEFPVVFMPGMEDGLFPGSRAMDSAEGLEEERRLCYVGITRAKEKLYMTSAETRMLYGRTDYTRESQFLKEIDKGLFDSQSDEIGKRSYQEPEGMSVSASGRRAARYSIDNKPFDRVKEIKAKSAKQKMAQNAGSTDFAKGDKVHHAKFGDGLVVKVSNNNIATIAFDSVGIKKLALGMAPLEKRD